MAVRSDAYLLKYSVRKELVDTIRQAKPAGVRLSSKVAEKIALHAIDEWLSGRAGMHRQASAAPRNSARRSYSKIILRPLEPYGSIRVGLSGANAFMATPGFLHHAEFRTNSVLMAVILIVEDDVFIRQNAEWMIEDLGHNALLAGDSDGALSQLSASRHIDALFVDIRLNSEPLGGYAIADQAVLQRPLLRVLYTSGNSLTPEMTRQFVCGGQFLQKPYSPVQLEFSIGELFH